jgi:hypothetical protein
MNGVDEWSLSHGTRFFVLLASDGRTDDWYVCDEMSTHQNFHGLLGSFALLSR